MVKFHSPLVGDLLKTDDIHSQHTDLSHCQSLVYLGKPLYHMLPHVRVTMVTALTILPG